MYSFEVRSGSIRPDEIQALTHHLMISIGSDNGSVDQNNRYREIRDKYAVLDLYADIIPPNIIQEVFATGSIPADEINEALKKSTYFADANQESWVKLWHAPFLLGDEKFAEVLETVRKEWNSRKFKILGEVLHVAGLLLQHSSDDVPGFSSVDVVSNAKAYIDWMIENNHLRPPFRDEPSRWDETGYGGLGYYSLENESFKHVLAYVEIRL